MQLLPDKPTLGRLINTPLALCSQTLQRVEKHSRIKEAVCDDS